MFKKKAICVLDKIKFKYFLNNILKSVFKI